MEASNGWNGGSKRGDARNDSLSPHHVAETPCGKGFRHGESLPKGLPKGLPNGLPIQDGFGRMADALRITKAYTRCAHDLEIRPNCSAHENGNMGGRLGRRLGSPLGMVSPCRFPLYRGVSCDYGGTVANFIQNVNHPGKSTSGHRRQGCGPRHWPSWRPRSWDGRRRRPGWLC